MKFSIEFDGNEPLELAMQEADAPKVATMSAETDEARYKRTLERMHIATQRNQPWWGLCPIGTRLGYSPWSDKTLEECEAEREKAIEAQHHWFLAWCLSRPAGVLSAQRSPFAG